VHVGPMAESLPAEVTRPATETEPAMVDLASLIGLLWGAVQELTTKVTELESRLPAQ